MGSETVYIVFCLQFHLLFAWILNAFVNLNINSNQLCTARTVWSDSVIRLVSVRFDKFITCTQTVTNEKQRRTEMTDEKQKTPDQ